MVPFRDSRFLIAAWKQLLETQSPGTAVFHVKGRKVTTQEVMAALEGKTMDLETISAITEFLTTVVAEAVHTVRGRFAAGLDNGGGSK